MNYKYILNYKGLEIKVNVKRIKNLILKLMPNGDICLSSPINISSSVIEKFLNSRYEWILANRFTKTAVNQLIDGDIVYIFGDKYIVNVNITNKNGVEVNQNIITINCKTSEYNYKLKILNTYLKEQLTIYCQKAFNQFKDCYGLKASSFCIRKVSSRFGSYSKKTDNIMLAFRLVHYPINCINYVIAHELAHTIHFNHSKDFYLMLSKICPEHKNIKQFIIKNSNKFNL